ncbi:MAG: efflux RND transporter periplasmic adaptor subunit [Candidatus Paceibacterota bacterium]|jgi:multidrug efflux pump subunit AcrA (membrane-fusion protein)
MEKIVNFFKSIKFFVFHNPWTMTILALVLVGAGLWAYKNKNNTPEINFAVTKIGEVSQTVSVTGRVKPAKEVGLSFEKSGRVASVYREVGENINAGEPISSLDNSDISAQLSQAKATVKAEQARLDELKSGARPEDINVSEVAVQNAVNDLVNNIKSGYVSADDSIHNKVDQFMSNPRSASPKLNFIINNSQLTIYIESGRPVIETMLNSWNVSVAGISASRDITPYISEAKSNLRLEQSFLDNVAEAVNSLTTNANISQTTIDGYKAAVSSARTNVNTALDGITAAEEKYKNASSSLSLKKAGATKEQLDAQTAKVEGAEANVMSLEAQLAKTVLRSPISGVVTKQDAKVGEMAPAGTVLSAVISNARYEIEANIPEADIAKIKVGDNAEVTLDAYGNDAVFFAVVSKIDPAETIIDGVATYKTTLQFDKNDARVKPGMTANTDISGQKKSNILFIPGRTISTKDGVKTVILVEGDNVREVVVTTGLRGSNGDVEILSGLKEGDKIKTNQ